MLVRSSFKWVPPPAPVQVNRPILTPADLNKLSEEALRGCIDTVVAGPNSPHCAKPFASFITMCILSKLQHLVSSMGGEAAMQQSLLGRVVTHFTGRSYLSDERDAQYIGNRMGAFLKRYRTNVAKARSSAKQKRRRLLNKDADALPHCAANGDGDPSVVALEEGMYVCTYGATPPVIATHARLPVPHQPTNALDVAQQLHFELQEAKEQLRESASREKLAGKERDTAVASKAASSGRVDRLALQLVSSRCDQEAAARKTAELKASLWDVGKEVQSQKGKVHKLEARVCRVQVEAARSIEEQRCVAEAAEAQRGRVELEAELKLDQQRRVAEAERCEAERKLDQQRRVAEAKRVKEQLETERRVDEQRRIAENQRGRAQREAERRADLQRRVAETLDRKTTKLRAALENESAKSQRARELKAAMAMLKRAAVKQLSSKHTYIHHSFAHLFTSLYFTHHYLPLSLLIPPHPLPSPHSQKPARGEAPDKACCSAERAH